MTRLCRRAVAVVLFWGLSAFADRPRLLLTPWAKGEGVSERAAVRLEALMVEGLQESGALELVQLPQVAEMMEGGKRALEALRFEEAAATFSRALALLVAEPAKAEPSSLNECYLGLATALLRLGEEREAKEALIALACVAPNLRLPSAYPRALRREFDKAKRRVLNRPRGPLAIDGPKDARVRVDGRELGRVPVLIDWTVVGRHLVQVEGAGGERFGRFVDLNPRLTKVHASFDPDALVLDEGNLKQLSAFTQVAGAGYALMGAVSRSSGTRLTAGLALYVRSLDAVSPLEPFRLEAEEALVRSQIQTIGEEIVRRLTSAGPPAALPVSLVVRPRPAPERAPLVLPPALLPQVVDQEARGLGALSLEARPQSPQAAVRQGPPIWVYVAGGVAVAAGLGVGGYFGISALTRPVTGTVNASW